MQIISINTNKGFKNKIERIKKYFDKADVLCLQETSIIDLKIKQTLKEKLGVKVYVSNGGKIVREWQY